uniref:antiviral innate immune response receptor RIG-I n=1 Tax=Myxine glutinosa TaxID=7769 RepID=UPI0035900E57
MAEEFGQLLRNSEVRLEEFRELLKLHHNVVCRIVSAPDICLPFMSMEEKESVEAKTKIDGETAGARQLIDYLLSCQQPNWPIIFLEALHKAEYKTLAYALLESDLKRINDMEKKKEIIKKTEVILLDVHASALLPSLSKSLRLSDSEHILREENNNGPRAAIKVLLHALRRSDNLYWFEHLIKALKHNQHDHIIKVLLPSPEERVLYLGDQSENSEDDYRRGMKQTDNRFILRSYQLELAGPALSGLNCIIVAPTGSGKTLVAVTICRQHLDSACTGEKPRRVAFLVRTNPMLQQQFDVFTNAMKGTEYTVSKLGGNNEDAETFSVASSASIMVISAQILVDAVYLGSLSSLSHFSLLVLDECHHTMKRHMYNRVLLFYLREKLYRSPPTSLPQIVGLTASVGTGDKQNVVNHVLQLCANLDCPNIITVRKNCEELAEYVTQIEPEIIEVGQRVVDPFLHLMSGVMDDVENLLMEVCRTSGVHKEVLGKDVPRRNRGEPVYEQWVICTQRTGVTLNLADVEAERRVCRQILACTEYLRTYNNSLIINNTARTCDAASFLLKFSDKMRNDFEYYNEGYKQEQTVIDTEKKLGAILHSIEDQLKALHAADGGESPHLLKLQDLLMEQYKTTPTTKTLLFVCTRDLGQVLIDWMETIPFMAELKPCLLVGRCHSSAQGSSLGMTHHQQNSVLNMFSKEGSADAAEDASSCHLLIATSVADEGIDIRVCNLVVLLDHVGNVIRMVQTRGRGRAKDSRCVLIASERLGSAHRYKATLVQERSMADAIRYIQKMDQGSIKDELLKLQMQAIEQFKKEQTQETTAEDEVYNMLCVKCQEQALTTRDLRLIKNAHHTVIKPGFEDSIKKRPHKDPRSFDGFHKNAKIFHRRCGQDWGVSGTYQANTYPVLKIKGFVFQNQKTLQKCQMKNWKDLQITIAPLNTEMEMEISSEEADSNMESQE